MGTSSETLSMVQYQVQISRVPTFGSLLWNVATVSPSYAVPSGVLGANQVYYWQVIASNGAGQATSTVFTFTTGGAVVAVDAGADAQAPIEAAMPPDLRQGDVALDVAPDVAAEIGPKPQPDLAAPDLTPDISYPVDVTAQGAVTMTFANGSAGDAAARLVTSEPAGITCTNGAGTCSALFDVGARVILFATPATGWHFVYWSGNCAPDTSQATTLSVSAGTSPLTCTANFAIDTPDAAVPDAFPGDAQDLLGPETADVYPDGFGAGGPAASTEG